MGLDMHLTGEKYLWEDHKHPERNRMEDGFRVHSVRLELGYWRKHPNLHGFIVATFADGVDQCQEIELDSDAIKIIIDAIEYNKLPHTEGFFFGTSDTSKKQQKKDLDIFGKALAWLEGGQKMPPLDPKHEPEVTGPLQITAIPLDALAKLKETRAVIYRASW